MRPNRSLAHFRMFAVLIAVWGLLVSTGVAAEPARLEVIAGGGEQVEGPATECKLKAPFGVEFDSQGRMYIAELYGERLLRVDTKGQLTWIGGTGIKGDTGDGGPARTAQFNGMHALVITATDQVLLADTWNYRVRRYDIPTGTLQPFCGAGGEKAYAGDGGPALAARFSGIFCVALDKAEEWLTLVDLDNRRIRRMNLKTGLVELVAGNGQKGVPADGADAKNSPLVDPRAAAVAPDGTVYILERGGHALRAVDPKGVIRTVVGTGKAGLSGDDGPALAATLNGPKHLCIDTDGSVLIADTENHVIRRYQPQTGLITRVAGTGKKGLGPSGSPALECGLFQPHGVYVHTNGVLYITDSGNDRVLIYRTP